MKDKHIHRFSSIGSFHTISGLPKPEHPLVSLVDYGKVEYQTDENEISWIQDFYLLENSDTDSSSMILMKD
jgi:AraC family transcriptional activator of pobA